MKKNSIVSLLILIFCSFLLIGCKPKGDPAAVINSYYQNIKDGKYESAYNLLSEKSMSYVNLKDFLTWQTLSIEAYKLKNIDIQKVKEYKNKVIDGVKYKNVIEFNSIEKVQDFYKDREETGSYTRYVVNENGVWRIYRGLENGKTRVANLYNIVAWMYLDGKGKEKNLNEAATTFNKGLEYDNNVYDLYYGLGVTYLSLGRFDDSINASDKYLSLEKENSGKSSAYNVKGLDYMYKGINNKAKEMFNKSIELDPNNEYAKSNLASLK